MTQPPLISVIVTVYNGEDYLAEAIDSILQQSWRPLELIVVDDGSTDGTARIAQSYGEPVRHHYQTNSGQGAARNTGVSLAKGEWLAFLDADDLWLPEKLTRQMALLESQPECDMVFGLMKMFASPELSEERRRALQDDGQTVPGYSSCTMLLRRSALERSGPFSTTFKLGEFMDWYSRAQQGGLKHAMLQEVVTLRRLHDNNMGVKLKNQRHEYLRVIKDTLDRKRQG